MSELPELKVADIYDCTGHMCIGLSIVGKNIELTESQANEIIRRCKAYPKLIEIIQECQSRRFYAESEDCADDLRQALREAEKGE